MFWIAVIGLPIVGGLHSYAANRGYRNIDSRKAGIEALRVAAILAVFSLLFAIARLAG